MAMNKLADPFYGLPVDLNEYPDGTISFENTITGRKCLAYRKDEMICIPIDYFCSIAVPAREAAEMLEVSKQRINQLCEDGTLHSGTIGKSRFVSKRDIIAYALTRKGRENA